jgi:hypothetical protein
VPTCLQRSTRPPVASLLQVRPVSCPCLTSTTSVTSDQHAAVFPRSTSLLSRSPLYRLATFSALASHDATRAPKTITPCCTLPKGVDARDNADVVTDGADHGSPSSSSSPMSHPLAHRTHAHAQSCRCVAAASSTRSPTGMSALVPLRAHTHFCPPAQCSHASGSAAVAPSATLASSTLAVLLAEAGASAVWCCKTAQGRASAYASAATMALNRAQYDAATRRDKRRAHARCAAEKPPTGHNTASRLDAAGGEHTRKALPTGHDNEDVIWGE